jgi:hypothetical protein
MAEAWAAVALEWLHAPPEASCKTAQPSAERQLGSIVQEMAAVHGVLAARRQRQPSGAALVSDPSQALRPHARPQWQR